MEESGVALDFRFTAEQLQLEKTVRNYLDTKLPSGLEEELEV